MKQNLTILLILLFFLSSCESNNFSDNNIRIKREFAGISLGMSINEVVKKFQIVKKEDNAILLMRYIGVGNPDEQARINKLLGKQVFDLKGNLPEGVKNIEVFFRNELLYRIAVHYGKQYIQRVDWDVFTAPTIEKYGQPNVSKFSNTKVDSVISYKWKNDKTNLEITKRSWRSNNKTIFIVSAYNVFYTDIVIYNSLNQDEKSIKIEVNSVPEF